MALESPLKKEVILAGQELDKLNRNYNVYFQGGEDDPPREERRKLDSLVTKIKLQMPMASNASDKFQANAMIARYQTMTAKWDKTLRGIEDGTIARPSKRK